MGDDTDDDERSLSKTNKSWKIQIERRWRKVEKIRWICDFYFFPFKKTKFKWWVYGFRIKFILKWMWKLLLVFVVLNITWIFILSLIVSWWLGVMPKKKSSFQIILFLIRPFMWEHKSTFSFFTFMLIFKKDQKIGYFQRTNQQL